MKYEKLFLYTIEYIEGLNGFNMNFRNKTNIFYGKKTTNLLQSLKKENYLCSEGKLNDEESKNNENILFIEFLKKLTFYRLNRKIKKDPYGILNYNCNYFF